MHSEGGSVTGKLKPIVLDAMGVISSISIMEFETLYLDLWIKT
jgi:hypothetical protein